MKIQVITAFAVCTILAACGADIKDADTNPTTGMKEGGGMFSGESGNILDTFRQGKGKNGNSGISLGVNAYLWRAALEAVSFMPLIQVDSAGGVLISDWYINPERPAERVKLNVYILGRSLQAQSLKVSVFKQVRKSAKWIDVPASTETALQLEETILTNARTLRVKEKVSN